MRRTPASRARAPAVDPPPPVATVSRALPLAALVAAVLLGAPEALAAQPLTERTPNLQGTWVTSPRNLHFQFSHRFRVLGDDVDITDIFADAELVNYPTFDFSYGLFDGAMLGFRYSSSSLFAGRVNEWQPYVKVAPVRAVGDGALSLSLLGAWNDANESLDGELAVETRLDRLFLVGSVRGFTDIFGPAVVGEAEDEAVALAGGLGIRVNRYVTLAGDFADVVGGPDGDAAWSAGLHLGIPFTPHTLSVMATNVTSGTLAGSSRGVDGAVFWGFEFTVPFSGIARWGRIFEPGELGQAVAEGRAPAGERVVEVEISNFEFGPQELRIPVGTTVRWVNRDPVGHTSTSDAGLWGSALLGPGETFEFTFDETGEYAYHCTPHPFMQATVVVEGSS